MNSLDNVVHVIQTALTPAFLLSGIAALLQVFSSRLGRVADRIDQLSLRIDRGTQGDGLYYCVQLAHLRHRTKLLDIAVVLGAAGGALTCLAALMLFLGGIGDTVTAARILFWAFGLALASTMGAVAAFLGEMLLSSRGLRAEAAIREAQAVGDDRPLASLQ